MPTTTWGEVLLVVVCCRPDTVNGFHKSTFSTSSFSLSLCLMMPLVSASVACLISHTNSSENNSCWTGNSRPDKGEGSRLFRYVSPKLLGSERRMRAFGGRRGRQEGMTGVNETSYGRIMLKVKKIIYVDFTWNSFKRWDKVDIGTSTKLSRQAWFGCTCKVCIDYYQIMCCTV